MKCELLVYNNGSIEPTPRTGEESNLTIYYAQKFKATTKHMGKPGGLKLEIKHNILIIAKRINIHNKSG
jgi:hypothetical protein